MSSSPDNIIGLFADQPDLIETVSEEALQAREEIPCGSPVTDVVPKTLLDTDIFSELMRGKNEVVRARADAYLKQHDRLTISTITVLEVAKGLHKVRREARIRATGYELASVNWRIAAGDAPIT